MNFQLRDEDLLKTAHEIYNAVSDIDGALTKIDELMNNLESVWSDENSKTYLERYNELKTKFPGFKKAIDDYGKFLERVVLDYKEAFSDPTSRSVNA